eukprot:364871-Chlamydomonas_euryale.AAC.12
MCAHHTRACSGQLSPITRCQRVLPDTERVQSDSPWVEPHPEATPGRSPTLSVYSQAASGCSHTQRLRLGAP